MIRKCEPEDRAEIAAVINDGARAYRNVVPKRLLTDPYMPEDELEEEIRTVSFYGYEEDGRLVGVMGIEPVRDVTLLRHAYVRTSHQRRGIGRALLRHIESLTRTEGLMLGTWAGMRAITFYLKLGFDYLPNKDALLAEYWPRVSRDQAAHSVVMGRRVRKPCSAVEPHWH